MTRTVPLADVAVLGVAVLDVVLVVLAVSLLPAVWRIARGPAEVDRAVAADHVFFVFVASTAVLALRFERWGLLDLVVVGTLIGFISAVTLARLVGRSQR